MKIHSEEVDGMALSGTPAGVTLLYSRNPVACATGSLKIAPFGLALNWSLVPGKGVS